MSIPIPPLPASTATARRGPWEVQRGVLFALLLREMKARVGGQWIGAVWTLFEPTAHVLLTLMLFTAIRGNSLLGGSDFPLFLATGMVPFFLFQHLAMRLMDGIDANKGLFSYRQVTPLDTLISRAIVEALMNLAVYIFTLSLLGALGFHVVPVSPLEMLGVHLLLFMQGAAFGVFFAVVSHDRPRLRSFIRMAMLPLYLITGVVFPIHVIPQPTLDWLLLNPLLHLVELSREAFLPGYHILDGVGVVYPALWSLAIAYLALLAYRADRLRLVTST
jgi:capsular polysaccharide transport system permease protein